MFLKLASVLESLLGAIDSSLVAGDASVCDEKELKAHHQQAEKNGAFAAESVINIGMWWKLN